MGKFNSYAVKVNDIAVNAFKEYKDAEAAYNKAREQVRAYPQRVGMVSADYAAKAARADADLIEARERYNKAQNMLQDRKNDIKALRQQLANELSVHYSADPTKLDGNTIELLKSGMLNPNEYLNLLNKARAENNHTMERLVAKYAGEAAEAETAKNGSSQVADKYRAVSYMVNQNYGADELATFDVMAEAYRRTADNPSMIDAWDDLTHNARERL